MLPRCTCEGCAKVPESRRLGGLRVRLFAHLFMLLALLSVAILPGQAHISSGATEHHFHAGEAYASVQCSKSAQYSKSASFKNAQDSIQTLSGVERGKPRTERIKHCTLYHDDNCCCVTCVLGFAPPPGSSLQINLLSHSLTLPIPRADVRRADAQLGVTLRPPIFS